MPDEAIEEGKQSFKLLKMEYSFPESQQGIFANNLIVQHDDSSFYLSFFQVFPPVIMGSPDEMRQKASSLESVTADCVARIVIPATQMEAFSNALAENLSNYQLRHSPSQSQRSD